MGAFVADEQKNEGPVKTSLVQHGRASEDSFDTHRFATPVWISICTEALENQVDFQTYPIKPI